MVVVFVIAATSALVIMVMVMVMMIVIFMVAATSTLMVVMMLVIMIVVMVVVFMVAATSTLMVVMMLVIVVMVFVIMMMLMVMYMSAFRAYFLCHHFVSQRNWFFHNFQDLLSIQLLDRSCDDGCSFVDLSQDFHRLLCFLLIYDICTAHDDRTSILYLIIEKFTEVSHIHFALFGIYYCCVAVQHNVHISLNILHSFDHIRKFADT